MLQQALRYISWILLCLLVLAVTITRLPRSCSRAQSGTVVVHDTLRLYSQQLVLAKERIKPLRRVRSDLRVDNALSDSVALRTTLIRDQLTDSLERQGFEELLVLDSTVCISATLNSTHLALPLEIHDTCDCIQRRVRLALTLRDTIFDLPRAEPQVLRSPTYSIGVGLCYGLMLDGRLTPSIGLSITRTLVSF